MRFLDALIAKLGQKFKGVTRRYSISEWNGYAGHFEPAVIEQLKANANVQSVDSDCCRKSLVQQKKASWGLQYISHKKKSTDGLYIYDKSAGEKTWAYVVDTGILTSHKEFEGRASLGYNAEKGTKFIDKVGHGTFVAGIVGGQTYGVAKKCNLIAVKVFDTISSTDSILLDGYTWAVNDIVKKKRQGKAVINVSVGSAYKDGAMDGAVDMAFKKGITTVVAAGNDGKDASEVSPAGAKGAFTVSAADENYVTARGSNTGASVAMFAPGVRITSAFKTGKKATATKSGTSFAAPFVAGLVVYLKAMKPLPNADRTKKELLRIALPSLIKDPNGSANMFAYNGNGA
ncbi:alkaline protease [Myriangium duriaei CBS 260.36]|uniref:Alkaline protease n=1 Tax=Myriangium duriaei CBS 260.36 TaxID=1168546 RepID=A0A9P4MCS1_9PEZI|nr:alkaline protease [Myriangium duriaei CBS 260.36]